MSIFLNRVIAVGGTVVVMVAFQRLVSNRRGSEQRVEELIAILTPASWNFVAMEYCYGILNRTYLILVTDHTICGARIRGPMSSPMIVTERHYHPYFYFYPRVVQKYSHMNVESPAFLNVSRANFQIPRHDIERCEFTAKPKWGMGPLPYSGRLILHLRNGSARELILLGKQDGRDLKARLAGRNQECGLGLDSRESPNRQA